MQQIIDTVLSQKQPKIPKLPKNITAADVKMLEDAVRNSAGRKIELSLLKLLLAEAYRKVESEKCSRQISDIGFQALLGSPHELEARFRVCSLISDTFDQTKLDTIKYHFNQINQNPKMSDPLNKSKLEVLKAGDEALKTNYFKAGIGYLNAAKDEVLSSGISSEERIQLVEKSILMCFLAARTKELHQLICQLYVNSLAKKSELYPLLVRMYTETIIDPQQTQLLKKLLPPKFMKKDADNVSMLAKSIFIHNMIPIKKSFCSISLQNLCKFTEINQQELLIMIEKSYTNKEIEIDQVDGFVYLKEQAVQRDQHLIKQLFDDLEDLVDSTTIGKN